MHVVVFRYSEKNTTKVFKESSLLLYSFLLNLSQKN